MGKKKATMLYKLVSTAATGFFYLGKKNIKKAGTKKLSLAKYDPLINRYAVFNETKLASGKKR